MTGKQEQRQSNIELLRMIAMLLIVAHHFASHSGFDYPLEQISVNRLWVQFAVVGGKIGVNVFVLITGYFLVSQQTMKTSRLMKLWGQIFFYSVIFFLIFILFGKEPFGMIKLIWALAPVTFSRWWFASTYFVLYLLFPYINRLLVSFDKKQYMRFLTLLVLLWSVIPTLTGEYFQCNSLLWFMTLYAIAGYIRIFGCKIDLTGGKWIGLSLACFLLTFLSTVILDVLGTKIPFFGVRATFFYDPMQKLPALVIAVLMLLGFTKIKAGYSKWINTMASATFGVYLIHENEYVRQFLWKTLFPSAAYAESHLLIPYSVMAIVTVFVGCTIIELMRKYLIEIRMVSFIDRISLFIDHKINSLMSDERLPQ